jgi:hypothetical protein
MNNEERLALINEMAQPMQTLTSALPLCMDALDRLNEIHVRLCQETDADAPDESEDEQ